MRLASNRIFIDLNHVVHAGTTTYPGLPTPTITPHLTRDQSPSVYAPGAEFAMDIITMIGNTGTYLDSPHHRFASGPDLAGLPLDHLDLQNDSLEDVGGVEADRAQLDEIVQRVRDGRLRTNIGNVSKLDDAVAAFNPTERPTGKTIIRVRP